MGEAATGDDPESDMRRAIGGMISSSYLSTYLGTIPLTFMAILLVCRLQAATFTTFVVILPVFLFLSCGCCAFFCGLCVLVNTDAEAMSHRMGDPSAGGEGSGGGGVDVERGDTYEPPAHKQVRLWPAWKCVNALVLAHIQAHLPPPSSVVGQVRLCPAWICSFSPVPAHIQAPQPLHGRAHAGDDAVHRPVDVVVGACRARARTGPRRRPAGDA